MHELGIARDIMRAVAEHAKGKKIRSVAVEVGALAGVSADALDFCIVETAREMGLGKPRITIRQTPVAFKCSCGQEYQTDDPLGGCPSCGNYTREIVSGMDVVIREVELESKRGGRKQEGAGRQTRKSTRTRRKGSRP